MIHHLFTRHGLHHPRTAIRRLATGVSEIRRPLRNHNRHFVRSREHSS
jgi:hypothetical protein